MKKSILTILTTCGLIMNTFAIDIVEEEALTGRCIPPASKEEAVVREAYDIALGENKTDLFCWEIVREVAREYGYKELDQAHLERYFYYEMEKVWGLN